MFFHGGWPGAFQDKQEYTVQQEPLKKVAEERPGYNRAGMKPAPTEAIQSIIPASEARRESVIKKDSGQAGMTNSNTIGSTSSKKPGMTKLDKNDWKTWAALSVWAKTAPVNTYWIDFASTISNKIKKGSKLSAKDRADMEKSWKQAVKNGFVDSNI